MKIARYEKRIVGWLIDEAFSLLVGVPVLVLLLYYSTDANSVYLAILYAVLSDYAFYIFLGGITMSISGGATFGMMITGIKCFCPNGNQLKIRECFLRSAMTGFLAMDIVNAIYMLVVHTERSVFDRLTENIVIDVRHGQD
jgi:uncharacterized RDD family membrane protein YckC